MACIPFHDLADMPVGHEPRGDTRTLARWNRLPQRLPGANQRVGCAVTPGPPHRAHGAAAQHGADCCTAAPARHICTEDGIWQLNCRAHPALMSDCKLPQAQGSARVPLVLHAMGTGRGLTYAELASIADRGRSWTRIVAAHSPMMVLPLPGSATVKRASKSPCRSPDVLCGADILCSVPESWLQSRPCVRKSQCQVHRQSQHERVPAQATSIRAAQGTLGSSVHRSIDNALCICLLSKVKDLQERASGHTSPSCVHLIAEQNGGALQDVLAGAVHGNLAPLSATPPTRLLSHISTWQHITPTCGPQGC